MRTLRRASFPGARDRRGQAIVEMALIAPVLLILIMAVWEFGRAWNIHQVITDAAREGARTAVIASANVTMPVDTARKVIMSRLMSASLDTTLAVVTDNGNFRAGLGTPYTQRIQYPFQFALVGGLLYWTTGQKSITLKTTITMRNE